LRGPLRDKGWHGSFDLGAEAEGALVGSLAVDHGSLEWPPRPSTARHGFGAGRRF
jgi:hypothetical protein